MLNTLPVKTTNSTSLQLRLNTDTNQPAMALNTQHTTMNMVIHRHQSKKDFLLNINYEHGQNVLAIVGNKEFVYFHLFLY